MKRKLVKQGGTALTVSLPAKWAKKYDLKAGDEIDLVEEGNKKLEKTWQKISKLNTSLDKLNIK